MSRCINMYARLFLGLQTRDNSGSYRCYDVGKLSEVDWDCTMAQGYAFLEEVLFPLPAGRLHFWRNADRVRRPPIRRHEDQLEGSRGSAVGDLSPGPAASYWISCEGAAVRLPLTRYQLNNSSRVSRRSLLAVATA